MKCKFAGIEQRQCRLTRSLGGFGIALLLSTALAVSALPEVVPSDDDTTGWSWRTSDGSVALARGETVVWQFNYADELDVPYFHPLATTSGQVLSWDSPPDHVWHHGFWFCWKYINEINYWELNRATGKPDGRTTWSDVTVRTRDDQSAQISMTLSYRPAAAGDVVLDEQRSIELSTPETSGAYRIDWVSTFVPRANEVVLDRTPPQEQAWGGYAGLSVRFAENLSQRRAISTSGPVTFGAGNRHRSRGPAMEYHGIIDGQAVGVAFLDHPDNPRHPTPWYLIRSPVMGYINAALLNDEPLTVDAGKTLTLRYRLIVHPGRWNADQLQAAYREYRDTRVSGPKH